jgi:uncharacterized protein YbcI
MGTFAHDRAPGRDRRQDLRLDRGIFAECYGRGPTKAKTYMVDDYVFTVLENSLTTVERTLVNNGREDLVRHVRLTFQEAERDKFKQAVTDASGRKAVTYHSQVTFHPCLGFEIFVLEPQPDEAA